ncbi:MAG TPA: phospholipase D-like domain-containing protein [Gemmatimonadales bacterium]
MTLPEIAPEPAERALQRAFGRAAGSPIIAGNRVDLLIDGTAAYPVMLALIGTARRRIHLENYIIRDDAAGKEFAERLIDRARAGVRIRLMFDWVGSFSTGHRYWRALRQAGVDVRAFGPLSLADPLLLFARDHRKVLVVDGEHAVAGGLCIGDEWTGNPSRGRLPWRDTAIALHGPAARELDRSFARAWTFNGGTAPDDGSELDGSPVLSGDTQVRVVATEPGRERGYRIIDLLLGVSASRIWVTEAYLSAPQRMYQAFKDAARDGADVRLLLPGSSDIRAVRNLSRIGYRGLLRAGVRIWEWNGPMLHAKTIVADGLWARIGSSNLNPSSLLANWEVDLFVYHAALAGEMEQQFLADLARSSEVLLRPRRIATMMGREVFPALARQAPSEAALSGHSRSFRERRTRAIILLGSVVQGARAAIFGPLALLLLVAAALFALFPRPMAWISAATATIAGVALVVRAIGHRARG